jgi:hypothetical protein
MKMPHFLINPLTVDGSGVHCLEEMGIRLL